MSHKRNKCAISTAALAFALSLGTSALAAPVTTSTSLPLDGNDLLAARVHYPEDEELEAFTTFIKGLDVFADHENPSSISDMNNRIINKKYYITPFYQVQEEDGVVGAQEIAALALDLLLSTMDLVESFDLNIVRLQEINDNLDIKEKALERLQEAWEEETDTDLRDSYMQMITALNESIAELEAERQELRFSGEEGVYETSLSLRQSVVNQIRLKLSFLGVSATSSEEADFASNDPMRMVDSLTTLIKRASTTSQFGVRQVVYKSGYTDKELEFISKYRQIRQDVQVNSLSAVTVYAKSTSLSTANAMDISFNKYVDGSRLYLGINEGSDGKCGNTRACNVTMDLTWTGSVTAQASRSGALVVPVIFEADINVMRPNFDGRVWCDFETGWQAKGRADVKDGAIVYDGDVYNKIHYEAFETGACNYTIYEGSKESAAYNIIQTIYDTYMDLKFQRGLKARDEKDAYQQYVNQELQWHADNAQSNNDYDFWAYRSWSSAFGPIWGTVTSFIIGSTRSFYWHTRIEDQKNTDSVSFNTRIRESNVQELQRFTFDGDPIVCWRGDFVEKYIGACPSEFKDEYAEDADHEVGAIDNLCDDDAFSADCLDEIEDAEDDETVDDNGVIDPWA